MRGTDTKRWLGRLALVAGVVLAPVAVGGQGSQFQFVVGAVDAAGVPVSDLKPEEVVMSENGQPAKVVKLEPFSLPFKITVAVDNGPASTEALAHYRSGLKGFVEALPPDVEVTFITMAPAPRMVVRPTADRAQILRGMDSFGPDQEPPRFTDTIVEYAQRLERELKDKKVGDYVPALVMVSTTGNEAADSQRQEVERAVKFLITRRARLIVAVMNTKAGDATAAAEVTTVRQALIAIPAVKATNGRFEALPVASRLATLLPEIGQQLAVAHTRQSKQFRVTVERPAGVTGPLQNPQIALTRTGVSGAVTLDGRLP